MYVNGALNVDNYVAPLDWFEHRKFTNDIQLFYVHCTPIY